MPFSSMLHQLSSENTLANVIVGLEVLQAVSSTLANLPLLNSIVGCVLGIAKTVEVRIWLWFLCHCHC